MEKNSSLQNGKQDIENKKHILKKEPQRMTLKEKTEYLSKYRKSVNEYHKAKEELNRLDEWVTNISPTMSHATRGSSNINKFDKYMEQKERLEASLLLIEEEKTQNELNTKMAIGSIADEDVRRYLSYYYLFFMTWEEAAEVAGYDCRYFMKKCQAGINKIDTLRHNTTQG